MIMMTTRPSRVHYVCNAVSLCVDDTSCPGANASAFIDRSIRPNWHDAPHGKKLVIKILSINLLTTKKCPILQESDALGISSQCKCNSRPSCCNSHKVKTSATSDTAYQCMK